MRQPSFPRTSCALARGIAAVAVLLLLPASIALADPPSRVARLALTEGAVSFSPAGEPDWVVASLNRPLVTGDRLWADDSARAEIQFAGATARLGAMTSVTLVNLDDRTQQVQLTQGSLQLRVRGLPGGDAIEIDTPNFAFVVSRPGVYRLDVAPSGDETTLQVRSGEGDVYGDGAAYRIASGQAVRFRGTDLRDSEALGLAPPDAFERWAQTRDGRYDRLASARYVAPEVVGYEDLDAYGTWRTVPNVGNVWTPRSVPAGWAPYRSGHWAWIDPWGWTWVDDAPWGFAPFHYGRWALVDDRWGWVPGPVRQRPVYAPALVAFVGGANFSLSVSSGPAIGWFPLAPGEVYRPAYTVSRDYFTRVNVTNTVVNTTYVTNIYNNRDRVADVRYANFARPAAITAVAPAVFAQSQPVQRAAVTIDSRIMNKAEVIPLAKVAPQRQSVIGAAPAARGAPPSTMQKPVVAKAPPPPPPASIDAKLPAMQAQPGKPLDRPAADPARPAAPPPSAAAQASPTQAVRVVKGADPRPLPAQLPRADASNGRGPPARDARDASNAPPATAAPPPPAAAPAQPALPQRNAAPPPPAAAPAQPALPQRNAAPPATTPAPRDNAKGAPPREASPAAPQAPANAAPPAPPQREEEKRPPPRPPQREEEKRPPPRPPQSNAPAPAAPPAPNAAPAQRPAETREKGNGPPPRANEAPSPPPRAIAPPPQSTPQSQPAPPPAPASPPRSGPPQAPTPVPQAAPPPAPKGPPPAQPAQSAPPIPPQQPAAAPPAPRNEPRGNAKGQGSDNRKEDDDKKK